MTRQRKTDQQRAQERLDVATRAEKRYSDAVARHKADLGEAERELEAAKARLEYAKQDPALKAGQSDSDERPPLAQPPLTAENERS